MSDEPREPDPDRAAILRRRQRFISLALSGLTAGLVGCSDGKTNPQACLKTGSKTEKTEKTKKTKTAPRPCLDVPAKTKTAPRPCLDVAPTKTKTAAPRPCLDVPIRKTAVPRPCLEPKPPPGHDERDQ